MSAIIKGFPDFYLNDFPVASWSQYPVEIPGSLASLPTKEDQLLDCVVSRLLKEKGLWDSENADEKRTLQNIKQMAKSLEIKNGKSLLSFFAYYHSKIGKEIETEVVDDIDMPEHVDAPSNSDYNLDYLSETRYVKYDRNKYRIVCEGVPGKMIFSVEHKNRKDEPTVPCSHCHQSGVVKCPECNGTGREEYEDGNYASGETRMRTATCHECGGRGKVPCPECNGTGQIDVYATKYSIIKSVKEIISVRVKALCSVPWRTSLIVSTPNELSKWMDMEDQDSSEVCMGVKVLDDINKKGEVSFLKKNRKDFIDDNRKGILDELSDLGLDELYKKNEEHSQAELSEAEKIRGSVFCRKEVHYVFPVVLLTAHYGEWNKQEFFFYESNGKVQACAMDVYPMSFGDVFKMKIKSVFKKA